MIEAGNAELVRLESNRMFLSILTGKSTNPKPQILDLEHESRVAGLSILLGRKQKQYVPMIAEEQVCILYAGVRGFLDKVQTSEIGKFEKLFLEHLKSKHSHIIDTIKVEKQLNDKVNAELRQILEEFIPTAGLAMKS